MSTPVDAAGPGSTPLPDRGFFGHPRGLSTLFFTEMWERFSYYGMRAILTLYMTKSLVEGGLGFDEKYASIIYATYVSSVWYLPLVGGWLADRILGARRAVLIGGIIIACGHYSMAISSLPSFYAGLVLIAIGTGLLKPNISAMVGQLYQTRMSDATPAFRSSTWASILGPSFLRLSLDFWRSTYGSEISSRRWVSIREVVGILDLAPRAWE